MFFALSIQQEIVELDAQFASDVAVASSNAELQRLADRYREQRGQIESRHLADRKRITDALNKTVKKQELKQTDAAWAQVRWTRTITVERRYVIIPCQRSYI